jgi:hypothetical protein
MAVVDAEITERRLPPGAMPLPGCDPRHSRFGFSPVVHRQIPFIAALIITEPSSSAYPYGILTRKTVVEVLSSYLLSGTIPVTLRLFGPVLRLRRPTWPYSTEAVIPPNKLYLIDRKIILVSPQSSFISQPISYSRRNRYFFATIERLMAPVSSMFGMNC